MQTKLLLVSVALTACASTSSSTKTVAMAPTAPAPIVAQLSEPVASNVEIEAATQIVEPEIARETSRETAPYARIFQEQSSWTLAMSSEQKVRCHVTEVETMCDRTKSQVVCDGDNQILAGTYVTTGRGMWRVSSGNEHAALDDGERTLARFPESFLDGSGNTVAKPFHGGWCTTESDNGTTRTICISEDKGFIGGAITQNGKRTVIGEVPKS